MTDGTSRTPPLPQLVAELWELIVAYFKQETVVPLKKLGRYVAYGALGAMLLGVGAVFLTMSGLRALQTETGSTFTGNLTWAPYGIVVVGLALGAWIVWSSRGARRKERA